eukprot:365958-Chlamydomonas_euryale.AAC.5
MAFQLQVKPARPGLWRARQVWGVKGRGVLPRPPSCRPHLVYTNDAPTLGVAGATWGVGCGRGKRSCLQQLKAVDLTWSPRVTRRRRAW